jgi:SAM-dependent methyltransferase
MTKPTPVFTEEYDRVRREPVPGDFAYVHLKDLADSLRPRLARAEGVWLDYGSGTSPYSAYTKNVRVMLADIADEEGSQSQPPDYVLEPGRPCPADDASFDGILSTQVLEHVPDPAFYLRDAFRMLRPGGELLLTTHGSWEDHPCPLDMSRWTAQGLREEVSDAGFEVVECVPLTCGVRGALLLLTRELNRVKWWKRYWSPMGLLLGLLRLIGRYKPAWLDRYADRSLEEQSIGLEGQDKLYVNLLVSAVKPSTTEPIGQ